MDGCHSRSVKVPGVLHNCSFALGVHLNMGCGHKVVEGLSAEFLTLEAAEPSLALEVEVGLPESYSVYLKVRIQGL